MFHQYLPESPSAANRFVLHERIEYVIIIVKLLDGFFFQENTQIFIGIYSLGKDFCKFNLCGFLCLQIR